MQKVLRGLRGFLEVVYSPRLTVGVAQLVEHWFVAPVVAGSSPVIHPTFVPSRYEYMSGL